jgi:hypothetical protein
MAGVYSSSGDASKKKTIDDIIVKWTPVKLDNPVYLKELIVICSKGKPGVVDKAPGLQFFIVKGGGEGFLSASHAGKDASRVVVIGGSTTASSSAPMTFVFDDTDLLIAFDRAGKFVSSALLRRPLSIMNAAPIVWTETTANTVYDAWDNSPVTLYRNTNFGPNSRYRGIDYFGLRVDDLKGFYAKNIARIDLHKKEATNGCIFILDDRTPPYSDKTALNIFEPQFIKDVQAAIGASTGAGIGTMRMLDVWDWPPPSPPHRPGASLGPARTLGP